MERTGIEKRLIEIENNIFEKYKNFTDVPKPIKKNIFDLLSEFNIPNSDSSINKELINSEFSRLLKQEKITRDILTKNQSVYNGYMNNALVKLNTNIDENSEKWQTKGYYRLNYDWKDYLITKRFLNHNNINQGNDFLKNLVIASFIAELNNQIIATNPKSYRLGVEQVNMMFFSNPALEIFETNNLTDQDKLLLKALAGGSVEHNLSTIDQQEFLETKNRLIKEILYEIFANLYANRQKEDFDESQWTIVSHYLRTLKIFSRNNNYEDKMTGEIMSYENFIKKSLLSISDVASDSFKNSMAENLSFEIKYQNKKI